ncbi:MAG: carboxypeptidase regulatory-like domain-containing protein [Chloroflexota bacterium]
MRLSLPKSLIHLTGLLIIGIASLCLAFLSLNVLVAEAFSDTPHTPTISTQVNRPDSGVFEVTGTILDSDNNPITNVEVVAFETAAKEAETISDSNGQFQVSLTDGNAYDIVLNPPQGSGLASQVQRGINTARDLQVTLPPGFSVSGIVYKNEAQTETLDNTEIFAYNPVTFEGFGVASSKNEGQYNASLAAGSWQLTFTPPPLLGLGAKRIDLEITENISRDLILEPGFTIYGRIVAEVDPTIGIKGVNIFAQDDNQGAGFGFIPSDERGYYTGTLPPGTYDLAFSPPSTPVGTGSLNFLVGAVITSGITGPPDVELAIVLPVGHLISGTVVDQCKNLNSPLVNAFIELKSQTKTSSVGLGTFTGIDGSYRLAVEAGVYTLTLTPPSGSQLDTFIVPSLTVDESIIKNIGYRCKYLPVILR